MIFFTWNWSKTDDGLQQTYRILQNVSPNFQNSPNKIHPNKDLFPKKFTQQNSPHKCWVNQFFCSNLFPPKSSPKKQVPRSQRANRVSPLSHFPEDVDHTGTSNALLAKVGHEYVEDKQQTKTT